VRVSDHGIPSIGTDFEDGTKIPSIGTDFAIKRISIKIKRIQIKNTRTLVAFDKFLVNCWYILDFYFFSVSQLFFFSF
jgi:hypothetical protein